VTGKANEYNREFERLAEQCRAINVLAKRRAEQATLEEVLNWFEVCLALLERYSSLEREVEALEQEFESERSSSIGPAGWSIERLSGRRETDELEDVLTPYLRRVCEIT
jgi:hypothetical protein